ncbi:hypothetical protein HK405_001245, partial [Cladochytrium tenue]
RRPYARVHPLTRCWVAWPTSLVEHSSERSGRQTAWTSTGCAQTRRLWTRTLRTLSCTRTHPYGWPGTFSCTANGCWPRQAISTTPLSPASPRATASQTLRPPSSSWSTAARKTRRSSRTPLTTATNCTTNLGSRRRSATYTLRGSKSGSR